MRHHLLSAILAIAASWASSAPGQEPDPTHLPQTGEPAAFAGQAFLELPLHRAAIEDTFWAQRSSYKVAVDAHGFEMVPDRGANAPRSLPFAWSTTSLRRGDTVYLPSSAPGFTAHGWNVEIAQPAWSEHWELRPEGLAQSWTLSNPLPGEGDLVLEGRLRTELACPPRDPQHAALVFSDEEGRSVVHYGEATVFDAQGRSLPVLTSWDGESVRLHVDGAWLDAATYPVVIDPLSAPVAFGPASTARPLGSISVAIERENQAGSLLVGFTRIWSATDHDVYAFTCNIDFSNPVLVYSDLSTARSDQDVDTSYAPGSDRWIVAHRSDASDPIFGATASLRVVYVDHGTTTNNTSPVQVLSSPSFTEAYTEPALGGGGESGLNDRVPLVFRSDVTTTRSNTPYSEIRIAWIDAAARTIGAPVGISSTAVGVRFDREHPAVTRSASANSYDWVVAWQELDQSFPSDDWDIRGARFDNQGIRRSETVLADGGGTRHATRPRIDGVLGYFCVAWGASSSFGSTDADSVRTRAFQWPSTTQAAPIFEGPVRTALDPLASGQPWALGDLSIDRDTLSHWVLGILEPVPDRAVGYRRVAKVLRLGGTGVPTEEFEFWNLPSENAIAPAIAMHKIRREFSIVGGSASNAGSLAGNTLTDPVGLGGTPLGGGCGGGDFFTSVPLAGNIRCFAGVRGITNGLRGFLLLSLGAGNLPLDGAGFPGCSLTIDVGAGYLTALPFTTTISLVGGATLVLPDDPAFRGDFYAQALIFTPHLPTALALSDGYQVRVR